MGIEVQSVRLLILAQQHLGVDFSNTLTIGRQEIMASAAQVERVFRSAGTPVSGSVARDLSGEAGRISDPLFRHLGAVEIDAMDVSDFEGASVIHDLNTDLPDGLAEQFSTVFDGGTLEHVFNVPTALASYMRMPKVGGHLVLALPANNEMGHGFYQFSPELFFRTLSIANGYNVEAMFLAPLFSNAKWLAVKDPALVGARVGFNSSQCYEYLFIVAKKIKSVPLFQTTPQQSDYSTEWTRVAAGEQRWSRPGVLSAKQRITRLVRPFIPRLLQQWRAERALGKRPRELENFVQFNPAAPEMATVRALYTTVPVISS
ncbi:hypothetical protein C8J24_1401 [Sphingomonas aerolata]|uniref:Methyltransferase family protein n=1 Tax=Sphingomonas aerolata TaxID=185951 RepID=A0A2T4YW40_9SPHN|nr:class I SAM-dependent methyltransferase [Sphingomonas aerolata]PTM47993.1 hypothetical protein C8J24_1401 [Sphingomonas aerolata]